MLRLNLCGIVYIYTKFAVLCTNGYTNLHDFENLTELFTTEVHISYLLR